MPTVDVFNLDSEVTGQLELSDAIFGVPVKSHVLHEVVVYQLAKRRAGNREDQRPQRSQGRRQKALEAKGHRARSRRNQPFPHLARRRDHSWSPAQGLRDAYTQKG